MAGRFDADVFCTTLMPMIRRKTFTYAAKDSLNEFVYQKRKQLQPDFVIPEEHVARWNPVDSDSGSDSAVSSTDEDLDNLPRNEVANWLDSFRTQLIAIFNFLLSDDLKLSFAKDVAGMFHLSVRQRSRLGII